MSDLTVQFMHLKRNGQIERAVTHTLRDGYEFEVYNAGDREWPVVRLRWQNGVLCLTTQGNGKPAPEAA